MKRKLNISRLYRLTKWIVIIVSIISLTYGLLLSYELGSERLLHTWEEICTNSKIQDPYCLSFGLQEINKIQYRMTSGLIIGILLPVIFFGGTILYKYLFPKINND